MTEDLLQKFREDASFDLDDKMRLSAHINNYLPKIESGTTNGVFAFCSSIVKTDGDVEIVDMNDPRATHRIYWDLEQAISTEVPIEECEAFEQENTIIYGEMHRLRLQFFSELLQASQSQKEARDKLKAKYGLKKGVCLWRAG